MTKHIVKRWEDWEMEALRALCESDIRISTMVYFAERLDRSTHSVFCKALDMGYIKPNGGWYEE